MSDLGSNLRASFGDLRRRKVFRVAAAYAVVAWVLLQLAEITFPAFGISDATMRLLVILVIAGFPLTAVLAWIFDITPEGVRRTPEQPAPGATALPRRWIDFTIIGVLAVAVAVLLYRDVREPGDTPAGERSIAVLPFVNMSDDPNNQYLSDGISEELLNVLARIEGLRVAARTSSFAFRDRNSDIKEIGRALNVNTVLEGSVRKSGKRLRVTAQLIDVRSGFHLWSDTYEATLNDVFAIQDQIASSIVQELELRLLNEPGQMLARPATASVEAYELYLLGRDRWHKRTAESLTEAIGFFERALAIDPDYVRAYTGLADSYILLVEYGNLVNEEALPRAEEALTQALARVEQLPPTHQAEVFASRGLLRQVQARRTEAAADYEHALALAPDNAMAHMWYGNLLNEMDQPAEALIQYRRAVELEPLSQPANINLSHALMRAGRYDEARQHFEVLLSITSEMEGFYQERVATTYRASGKLVEAVRAFRNALETHPDNLAAMAGLAVTWLDLGDVAQAREWAERAVGMDWRNERAVRARDAVLLAAGEDVKARDLLESWLSRKNRRELAWALNALALHELRSGNVAAAGTYLSEYLQSYDGQVTVFEDNIEEVITLAAFYHTSEDEAGLERVMAALGEYLDKSRDRGFQRPADDVLRAALASLRGDQKAAAGALVNALGAGYTSIWAIDAHPVFSELRKSDAFAAVAITAEEQRTAARRRALALSLPDYVPPAGHRTLSVPVPVLDRYTGFYQASKDKAPLEIRRFGNRLQARLGSEAPMELLPETETDFFVPDAVGLYRFQADASGRITHLLHISGGDTHRIKRVDYERPLEMALSVAVLDRYVGAYEFPDLFTLTVTRDGEYLYARTEKERRAMLLPASATEFFLLDSLATLRFVVDAAGRVDGAILEMDGVRREGHRLP